MMRVLVGCETSGKVREAFRRLGHDAVSCDLLPADDGSPDHCQGDVQAYIEQFYPAYDMLIIHPPCTYLSSSGLHWNKRVPGRAAKTEEALEFVSRIIETRIPRIVIENPRGCITTRLGWKLEKYGFVRSSVQPYEFGDDASKETVLLLKGVPPLVKDPAKRVPGRRVEWPVGSGKIVERWSNQTDSGQNRLGPSADRWKIRSETYPGIANAMADQWGRS